jgi:hypothetical protein
MMKGWDFNSTPVDAYKNRLRIFVVYLMLKWDLGTEDYSSLEIPPPQDNALKLPYNGAMRVFYYCLHNHPMYCQVTNMVHPNVQYQS